LRKGLYIWNAWREGGDEPCYRGSFGAVWTEYREVHVSRKSGFTPALWHGPADETKFFVRI